MPAVQRSCWNGQFRSVCNLHILTENWIVKYPVVKEEHNQGWCLMSASVISVFFKFKCQNVLPFELSSGCLDVGQQHSDAIGCCSATSVFQLCFIVCCGTACSL